MSQLSMYRDMVDVATRDKLHWHFSCHNELPPAASRRHDSSLILESSITILNGYHGISGVLTVCPALLTSITNTVLSISRLLYGWATMCVCVCVCERELALVQCTCSSIHRRTSTQDPVWSSILYVTVVADSFTSIISTMNTICSRHTRLVGKDQESLSQS